MQCCGLTMSDAVPDETTLCRFRNRLIQANKFDSLLASINAQLQQQNLMVKAATGAVIDATLIESAARPNKTITLETDQDGQAITYEDGSNPGVSCTEKTSVDGDATWSKMTDELNRAIALDDNDSDVHRILAAIRVNAGVKLQQLAGVKLH